MDEVARFPTGKLVIRTNGEVVQLVVAERIVWQGSLSDWSLALARSQPIPGTPKKVA